MKLVAVAIVVGGVVGSAPAQPARPAIDGIAHVRVLAADLAKARHFYGELLGLSEQRWDPAAGVAIFSVNDRQRIIVRRGPAERDDRLVDLAFATANVTAMRDWLASRGMQAASPAADPEAGGLAVSVTDPDGHAILLVGLPAPLPPAPAATGHALSRRILHAGLTVKDTAAADKFYKDALGFSEIWRGGRTDDVTSWINMRVPDGTDYLEYMLQSSRLEPASARDRSPHRAARARYPGGARARPRPHVRRRSESPRQSADRAQQPLAAESLRSRRHARRADGAVDGAVGQGMKP